MKYVLTDAAVRKLRGVLAPRSGNTGAGGAATSVSPDDFPCPWTVRWAQSELNGQGAWVIWMANTNSADVATGTLVYHGATALSPDNLIAATTLPAGWYRMYGITGDARSVYLRVVVPEGTDPTIQCTLSSSYPPPVANANNYRIKIATMSVDSTTGARRVKQYAASVITISDGESGGGGGGGLSGTVEFVADNDWYVNGSVHQFRKRLRVLDLATGQVTDKAGTTYANGWEVVTDTTPISQIIN